MPLLTQRLQISKNEIDRLKRKTEQLTTQLAIKEYYNCKLKKIIYGLIDTTPADISEQANIARRTEDFLSLEDSNGNFSDFNIRANITVNDNSYLLPIRLPKFLFMKRAILNIQNLDNRSFGYALLSFFKHPRKFPNHLTNYTESDFVKHKLANLPYPINPYSMAEMEACLKLNINLLTFDDADGRKIYTMYLGPHLHDRTINLIYWNNHYAWIKSIDRLLNCITDFHNKKYWCEKCLNYSISKPLYDAHVVECKQAPFQKRVIRFNLPKHRRSELQQRQKTIRKLLRRD